MLMGDALFLFVEGSVEVGEAFFASKRGDVAVRLSANV